MADPGGRWPGGGAVRLRRLLATPPLPVDRRQQAILALSAATGAGVGLTVGLFVRVVVDGSLDWVLDRPAWLQALLPLPGLALAAVALWALAGGAGPETDNEYVRAFHDRHRRLDLRPVLGRVVAGAATVGLGGALGPEGPGLYGGAAMGSATQQRASRVFRRDETKLLLVAGAAAGVAAVFKAPATGVVFALEMPYRDDIARRALIPSLVASAASYLVAVSIIGTAPLFPVLGVGGAFDLVHLGGAAVVGLLAGLGARAMAVLLGHARRVRASWPAWQRVLLAGAALGAAAAASGVLAEVPLTVGAGYQVLLRALNPGWGMGLIAALFALRLAATVATTAGGGVGGLMLPLAVQGVLLGRFVSEAVGPESSALYPVIGVAAFLGAGYRTPIASVMFVAETTGEATFVVPALIAAAVSQLMMGRASVAPSQLSVRAGHLERRFQLPITTALATDTLTVTADTTVAEFVWVHAIGSRQRSVPLLEDGRYLGMCAIDGIADIPREEWERTPVTAIVRTDLPVAERHWTLRDALAAMEAAGVDRVAVVDGAGQYVGVVLESEILKLDEILEETGG